MSPLHIPVLTKTGNEIIDREHLTWLDFFNKLERHVLNPQSDESDSYQQQALKDVLDFTRIHFANEETLMQQYDYPDAARHRRMHKDFEQQVYEQYRSVLDGHVVLNTELLKLLKNWFFTHTSTEDIRTFEHIHKVMGKQT